MHVSFFWNIRADFIENIDRKGSADGDMTAFVSIIMVILNGTVDHKGRKPFPSLVTNCRIFSKQSASATRFGEQACLAYSR